MKRILLIALVTLFTFSVNVSAKTASSTAATKSSVSESTVLKEMKGIVFDKLTNESLAGAVVTANGLKVYTDLDGNFIFPTNGMQKCTIKVSMISYADQIIDIDTNSSTKIQIKLQQR